MMEVDLTMKSDLEEYLENHPEFIQKWLLEKASPETVQEVLSSCSAIPRGSDHHHHLHEGGGSCSSHNEPKSEVETWNHNNNNRVHQNKNSSSGSVSPSSGNTISNLNASLHSGTTTTNGKGGEDQQSGDEIGEGISGEEIVKGNCSSGSGGGGGGVPDESSMIQRARSRSKRNSITSDRFQSWLSSSSPKSSNRRMTERRFTNPEDSSNLRSLDENALFIELVKDISNELDIDILCHKILVNVGYLAKAQRCTLHLARGPSEQRYLVPKLLDVTSESDIEDSLKRARSDETRIPFGVGIPGQVAQSKEIVNIKNAYEDSRFQKEMDTKSGHKTWSILALPVSNNEGEVIGVAQVINKKSADGDNHFSESDIEVIQRYLTFCGIGIQNAQLFETSVSEYRRNQLLLNLARSIFEEQTNLERLVTKIMKEAQGLLRCERSLVYLRDVPLMEASHIERILMMPSAPGERKPLSRRESKTVTMKDVLKEKGLLFELVFELTSDDQDEEIRRPSAAEISNSPLTQIAKYVATNSEILNIGDAITWYRDSVDLSKDLVPVAESSFYNSLPKSILCMPIYNGQRQVIGVAQLINKVNNQPFTDSDANTFEAFAIFCGLGIHNTQLYESACKLMAKQSVALECLSYHATASCDDTERLRRDEIPSSDYYNLYSYIFNDFSMTDSDTCKATIRMFLELNLVSKFHIPYPVLCRWVLSVKKNYRPVKYHNWRHAFNVAQTMFTVLTTGRMGQFLDDLDILGLIVACLCHDLDHRGTNNAFQQQSASPLAVLYSTSTMEHHHFDQCVMILSSEGNNIFQDLSADNYRKVMKIVEKSILSTDLAMYFRKKDRFIELIEEGEISWQGEDKKESISKPWEIQHKIAKLVADEFFDQGDLEKEQLNLQPQAMMDRDRKDELPKMQLSFIDVICCPLYKVLSETFPWLKPLYDGVNRNRQNWQDLAEKVDMGLTWIDYDVIEKPVEEFSKDSEPKDIKFVVQNLNCSNTESSSGDTDAANRRNKSRWKLKRLFRDTSQLRKSTSIQSKVSSSDVSSPLSKKDDILVSPPGVSCSPSANNSPSKPPSQAIQMVETSPEKQTTVVPASGPTGTDTTEKPFKTFVPSTNSSSKGTSKESTGTSTQKKNNCMIS